MVAVPSMDKLLSRATQTQDWHAVAAEAFRFLPRLQPNPTQPPPPQPTHTFPVQRRSPATMIKIWSMKKDNAGTSKKPKVSPGQIRVQKGWCLPFWSDAALRYVP